MDSTPSSSGPSSGSSLRDSTSSSETSMAEKQELCGMIQEFLRKQAERSQKASSKDANNNDTPTTSRQPITDFTMHDLDCLLTRDPIETRDKIAVMEKEIAQRKANIQRMSAASAKFQKDQEAKRERLAKYGEKLAKRYAKTGKEIAKTAAQCEEMQVKYEEAQRTTVFYEPLLQKLNVDPATMTCAEGKNLDPSGKPGTCDLWNCPKLVQKMDIQKNKDIPYSKEGKQQKKQGK